MVSKEYMTKKVMDDHKQKDFAEIVKLVLATPLRSGVPQEYIDGTVSMEEVSHMNTDVQTRIISQMAYDAAKGDVKAAEFLMKYGGLEPPQRQEILLDVPQLVDDMTDRISPAPPSPLALAIDSEDSEE